MAEFQAFTLGVEVNGDAVRSVVDGVGVFKEEALAMLAKHGIRDPQKGQWYSQQAWLDSFRSIAEGVGPATLFSIGYEIPRNALFPPEIDGVTNALQAIDVAYHMNHRVGGVVMFDPNGGGMLEGIGHYRFVALDGHNGKMVCENPYPCSFDRGIVTAMAQRFSTGVPRVRHDDTAPCRKNGADSCTYTVAW